MLVPKITVDKRKDWENFERKDLINAMTFVKRMSVQFIEQTASGLRSTGNPW